MNRSLLFKWSGLFFLGGDIKVFRQLVYRGIGNGPLFARCSTYYRRQPIQIHLYSRS